MVGRDQDILRASEISNHINLGRSDPSNRTCLRLSPDLSPLKLHWDKRFLSGPSDAIIQFCFKASRLSLPGWWVGVGAGWSRVWPLCFFTWEFVLQWPWKAEKRMEGSGKARGNFDLVLCMYFCVYISEKFHWGSFLLASICFHLLPHPQRSVSSFDFPHQPLDFHLLFREMAYTWLGSCVSPWVWEPWALDQSSSCLSQLKK